MQNPDPAIRQAARTALKLRAAIEKAQEKMVRRLARQFFAELTIKHK
jgi:hypothetical protein